MQRKPHKSDNVFVIPLSGFEIVYLARTEEILSMVRSEPASRPDDAAKPHPADVETRKKAS